MLLDDVATAKTDNQGGLLFDTPGSYVDVPSVSVDFKKPFCIESWCDPRDLAQTKNENRVLANLGPCQLNIHDNTFAQAVIVDVSNKKKPLVLRKESIPAQLEKEQLHIALQWTGDDLQMFINGVPSSGGFMTWKHNETPIAFAKRVTAASTSEQLCIGNFIDENTVTGSEDGHFSSSIYSLRVSQGLRYTSEFTPGKFSVDVQTKALYDFHEGEGDVLHDISGNGHDGTIHGATWVNADE